MDDFLRNRKFTINIVVFNESTTFSEYVDATLASVEDVIFSNRRVTVAGYPHASKIIRVYSVLDKLASAIFMNINSSSLSIVYVATDNSGVCTSLYFKSSYPVVMNVIRLKVALHQTKQYVE